jgi:retrograde regulation protein 2
MAMSDTDDEAALVGRALTAIVDIGSNGIRFSISSKAPHHSRIMPCVFKDRINISLIDVQYDTLGNKIPIPQETIHEVVAAMKRFKLICEDFGVLSSGVQIVATEATRQAVNSQELRDSIYDATGWEVELLDKEMEGKLGAFGVASSFNSLSGLFMELGGGSTQLSWIIVSEGEVKLSPTPVSLPYGAAELSRRIKLEDKKELFTEIQLAFQKAFQTIQIPDELIEQANSKGGLDLFTSGGGLRGLGYLLLSDMPNYPIPTIINGFSCAFNEFQNISDYLLLKESLPKPNEPTPFKISERRKTQLPATGLLISAAFHNTSTTLPIKTVHFSEGGVREGVLYSTLPREIRSQDPLLIASRPYAPLLAQKYLQLLSTALPSRHVPNEVIERIAPALCNLAFVHASYPKELQPTAALHVAITGIIAGSHGLSHHTRALIGIALCDRWGGDLPPSEVKFRDSLCDLVKRDGGGSGKSRIEMERLVWWSKYIGTLMYVICGVHPGGNIRDGVFNFKILDTSETANVATGAGLVANGGTGEEKRKFDVIVQISKDDLKTSASVRGRILTLQKKIRKLSKGSSEKVKIGVELYDH